VSDYPRNPSSLSDDKGEMMDDQQVTVSNKHPHELRDGTPAILDPEGRCLVCAREHHIQTIGDTILSLMRSLDPDNQRAVDTAIHEHILTGPLHVTKPLS
jgi:hypothetical protein